MRALPPILVPFALILTLAVPHTAAVRGEETQKRSKAPAASQAESPWLEWQVRLDRAGLTPEEIDGVEGANTRRAMETFAPERTRSWSATSLRFRTRCAETRPTS